MRKLLARLRSEKRASVALVYALSAVPILAAGGVAVDMARVTANTSELQAAADAAALAGIIARVPTTANRVTAATNSFNANYDGELTPTVSASGDTKLFTVTATADMPTAVMVAFGVDEVDLSATASTTKVFNGPPPCILALNKTVYGGVTITGTADFSATGCNVHANSAHSTGMVLEGSVAPEADGFCSVGGVSTTKTITPEPLEYCDEMKDPFASVQADQGGGCTYNNVEVSPKQTTTLNPGTYCGGLTLKGTVTLNPGTYVIKNGPLTITSQATVTGTGITFSLTGTNAGFTIDGGGGTDLKAAASGPYGGILIIQDKTANAGFENRLAGNSTTNIVGAIYTPTQKVTVTGASGFGQKTPFMPVIADSIRITGVLRSRLDPTGFDLPFPMPKSESSVRLVN